MFSPILIFLETTPDPNLIPSRPPNGCPSGTTDYQGVMCCCGRGSCWDYCSWNTPDETCLSGLENAFWMWDSSKQSWTAQNGKLVTILMLINHIRRR